MEACPLAAVDLFDVGCREGALFEWLLTSPNAARLQRLGGLDPSETGISETQTTLARLGRESSACFAASAQQLDSLVEPQSFDIVTCLHSLNWIDDFPALVKSMAKASRRFIVVSGFVSLTYESRNYSQSLKGSMAAQYQGEVVAFHWPSVWEFMDYFRGLRLVSIEYDKAWTGTPKMLPDYRREFSWIRIPRKIARVFKLPLAVVEPATDVTAVFEV